MLYRFLQFVFRTFFRLFFRARVLGTENMPSQGAVILAANHQSNWDPPFLATFLQRPVSYMAKQELFEVPVFGAAIRACHAFPIRRGAADRAAIKTALQVLKLQKCLGVFPEGTRSRDGQRHKAEAGVALLAAMSKAPVVPAAIMGTNHILGPGGSLPQLTVRYGKPLYFTGAHNDKAALQAFAQQVMAEIEKLIQEQTAADC